MGVKIVIDPGHGGSDSGAVAFGIREKDIVLDLALRTGKLLRSMGANIEYTRVTDIYVNLGDRARLANQLGADAFFSFHINAFNDPNANGFESFVHTSINGGRTAAIQNVVHRKIAEVFASAGVRDRGQKKANYQVLRETKMSALLIEYGFITNAKENSLLKDSAFLDRLARATADGIGQALGLKPVPPVEKLPTIQRTCDVEINGKEVGKGFLIDNVSYVPARLVAEALGAKVNWDDAAKKVLIKK